MSIRFEGNASKMREVTTQSCAKKIGIDFKKLNLNDQYAFTNLSTIISLVPDYSTWTTAEKKLMFEIIIAKGSKSEKEYLLLMQKHIKFRNALIKIGSKKMN